ncbi:unnamed protein product [Parascedosporium putredinis]|uniref:Uncharacterized protein n=1 Tax=Parascedosporium putredinis TaxID=1442378 RepID=A0A9P1HAZ8_9PEZI|nr:unnamed protein product [Parascedosporium putredinis]CAI8002598.1 unnamed protein product [Parascedosporium putredinis]
MARGIARRDQTSPPPAPAAPNTVATIQSTDLGTLTLGFDAYQTFIGPGVDPAAARHDCLIRVELDNAAPSRGRGRGGRGRGRRGDDVVAEVTVHGFAQFEAGLGGVFTTQYQFPRGRGAGAGGRSIRGISTRNDVPANSDLAAGLVYTKTDTVPLAQGAAGRCGRRQTLLIRTSVRVFASAAAAGGAGSGTLTVDDLTISLKRRGSRVGSQALAAVEQETEVAADEVVLELGATGALE